MLFKTRKLKHGFKAYSLNLGTVYTRGDTVYHTKDDYLKSINGFKVLYFNGFTCK